MVTVIEKYCLTVGTTSLKVKCHELISFSLSLQSESLELETLILAILLERVVGNCYLPQCQLKQGFGRDEARYPSFNSVVDYVFQTCPML